MASEKLSENTILDAQRLEKCVWPLGSRNRRPHSKTDHQMATMRRIFGRTRKEVAVEAYIKPKRIVLPSKTLL